MSDKLGVDVLGKVPSGLFIVTCAGSPGNGNHGVLASWVMQAGFMPPAISVAIKQDRSIMRDLKPGSIFCVNQLAKDDSACKALMTAFGKGFGIGADAFAGQEMGDGPHGGKYLKNALNYMECKLLRVLEPSTEHNLVIGEITGGGKLREGEPWVHIRKSGAHY